MEIEVTSWSAQRDVLQAIRRRVFIEEQGVPETLEWDDDDAHAVHFIARDGKRPVGCARLLADGTLGRMAVVLEYRRHGVGSQLVRAVESHYQHALHGRVLRANAQAQAFAFYRRNGFSAETGFNIDAGIAHLPMIKVAGHHGSPNETLAIGHDNMRYQFEPASGAAEALLQIGCQSNARSIDISIIDMALPIWSDLTTLSCINRFLREARQHHVRLLIASEYPGIADHKLLQLQQRMSSRIEIKVHGGVKDNLILMMPYAFVGIRRDRIVAELNTRPRVARLHDQFQELWRSSQPCREGRRLKI